MSNFTGAEPFTAKSNSLHPRKSGFCNAVVIGVSAGGVEALSTIIPVLPKGYRLPVIVVQHMQETRETYLATFLDKHSNISVKEAEDKESICAGTVYIAPPGYHLLIEDDFTFSLSMEPRVNFSRPAIDVLFESAADTYHENLAGVVLTGANMDGSRGLRRISEHHGLTIVQDPETAASTAMPRSAIRMVDVDHILPLNEIGPFLKNLDR